MGGEDAGAEKNIFSPDSPLAGRLLAETVVAYAGLKDKNVTDDGRVVELAGEKIKVVAGSPLNIKITYPQDLIIAKAIIKSALE